MKTIHEHLGFGSSFSNRSNARLKQYKLFNNSLTGNIHVNIKIVTSAETGFYYSNLDGHGVQKYWVLT